MFINNDVQHNILTLLNFGTRVCVLKKNETNIKFSHSNARTAKQRQKLDQKGRFLHNYPNDSEK